MNRDDILKMAREAEGIQFNYRPSEEFVCFAERFAALVAAAEREACAKLCLETEPFYGVMFAEAIRARGEK